MTSNKHKRLLNLDEDANKHLEEGARLNGMSKSCFVEFLANSWEQSIDPTKKLKYIDSELNLLKERIDSLEKEKNNIIEILQKKDQWNNRKQKELPKIVRNIVRVIQEGRAVDAEVMAKTQSIRFGIPAIEILNKATDIIDSGR